MLVRVSRPRSTRHFSGLFFAPAGHRLNVFRFPGAFVTECIILVHFWSLEKWAFEKSTYRCTDFSTNIIIVRSVVL